MTLNLKRTENPINRIEREGINNNWSKIERSFNDVVDIVSDNAYNQVVDAARLIWQEPVDTFADLVTTYPNAEEGWASLARDTGIVYRYNGTSGWRPIQQISAGPVNEVDRRLSKHLAQIEKLENFDVSSPRKVEPIACFVIDDGGVHDLLTVMPILRARGFRASSGIITSQVDNPSFPFTLTSAQIHQLEQVENWEVVSHATRDVDMTTLSAELVEEELKNSKQWLLDNGFTVRNFFLPRGNYNQTIKDLAKKYYRSVRVSGAATNTVINYSPFDTYQVESIFFGDSDGNGTSVDPRSGQIYDTVPYIKYYIDLAMSRKAAICIGLHSNTVYQNNRQADLAEICDYLVQIGMPVVTYNEMLNRVGNMVDTEGFKVGADGKIGGQYGRIKNAGYNGVLATANLTDYDDLYETSAYIGNGQGAGMPNNTGGHIKTFKTDTDFNRSYQLAKEYGKGGYYLREFLSDSQKSVWRRLDTLHVHEFLPASHTISDLVLGVLNVCFISTANASSYPDGIAGLLVAQRYYNNSGTIKETYSQINGAGEYERYWDSTTNTFSPWLKKIDVKILPFNSVTTTDSINKYPKGITHVQITAAHATAHGFPTGLAGVLETQNIFGAGYIWQYYRIVNSVDVYCRSFRSDNTWSDFVLK